jgi:hypothetical protein
VTHGSMMPLLLSLLLLLPLPLLLSLRRLQLRPLRRLLG